MGCLKRVVETAEEIVCVSVLSVVIGGDEEQAAPEVDDVVEAVQDYRGQSYGVTNHSWIMNLMYSDRILRWLSRRVIDVASKQGAFTDEREVRQVHEPGGEREV